jgi:hypothetical protein
MNSRRAEHRTQRSKLLRLLLEAHGAWVPLPEILDLKISQYNSRLYELRKLHFNIENRTESVNGVRHSWFRLVSGPQTAMPAPVQRPAVSPRGPGELFSPEEIERTRRQAYPD